MKILHALLKQIDNRWRESLEIRLFPTFLLHTVTGMVDVSSDRQTISRSSILWVFTISVSFLVRMSCSDGDHLTKCIVQRYNTIANRKKIVTVNHFIAENAPCETIYNIILK